MARMNEIDHLVYATPDVDATVAELSGRLGVRAAVGGRHPGRGTRNALIGLGPRCYLEIVGPDAEQAAPAGPRWFLIDELSSARLVAWAVRSDSLAELPGLGPIVSGSRQRPDGQLLAWRFTDPMVRVAGGVMPFLIDWGSGPHPADLLPREVRLLELRLEHPEPAALNAALSAVGFTVHAGPRPKVSATLETPRGTVVL
jgi:hypothetical protein